MCIRITLILSLLVPFALVAQAQSPDPTPEIQSHMLAAQQAQAMRDYDTAEKEYQAVARLAPTFAEAHMNLGLIHQLQGRESDAINDFRTALKLKPTLTGANFLLGVDYCKQGDGVAAIPYLKAAVAQQPAKVEFLSWLATAQDMVGQTSAEIATLHRALSIAPRDINLLYLLGQAYERLGKEQVAELKKSAPDSARAEQLVAESYSSTNEWPAAVIHFQNALAKSPTLPGLHVELGEVYLHAGKLKQASSEFDNELQVSPTSLRALVRRGEAKLLHGATSDALADWDRALAIDPVQTQHILGMRETGFGDATFEQLPSNLHTQLDQAQEELNNSQSPAAKLALAFIALQDGSAIPSHVGDVTQVRMPSCSSANILKILAKQGYSQLKHCVDSMSIPQVPIARRIDAANGLVAVGEYQSALHILDSLPAAQKRSPEASYWRARCYEKMATAAYLEMYQIDPNSFRVHQLLGDLAAARNDDPKAIEEYRAAVTLKPDAPNLHYSLGHILWKDLIIPDARVELEAELKINPRHAGALHDLGDTFLQEHQPEKALPYLQRAVSADPANPDIHRDLGTAYMQLKQYAKAEPEYKFGLANDQDGSVHYKLAKLYQAIGQRENADHEFAIYSAMNRQTHERLEKRGQRLADIERSAE